MANRNDIQNMPNRLRELRLARGLTLRQVGEAIGLAFTNVGKLETGERDMKQWHMEAFARLYEVAQADLLDEKNGGLSPEERAFIDTYRDMSPETKRTFEAFRDSHQHLRPTGEVIPINRDGPDRKRA